MDRDNHWNDRRSGIKPSRPNDPREPADHDLARVIHSASFRRLQSKTQVLGLGESDFYRTRLTHSIEVAQVATGIMRCVRHAHISDVLANLLPSIPQLTAISLAHDIGHPPYGHGGEVALNYMMRGKGGFEGNAQTLRILAHLESKTERHGLDLTRRTMLGVLKYPVAYTNVVGDHQRLRSADAKADSLRTVSAAAWKPPKCYYNADETLVQWILKPLSSSDRKAFQSYSEPTKSGEHGRSKYKSLDASLMDISDDISYAVHDFEDAIHMKLISDSRSDIEMVETAMESVDSHWRSESELNDVVSGLFGKKWERKEAISKLVNCMICSASLHELEAFQEPLLRYQIDVSPEARTLIDALKSLVLTKVIKSPEVQTLEYSGQQIVMELFEAMEASPTRLLPTDTQSKLSGRTGADLSRVICDHISGMTDDYAAKIYGRLFMPNAGSLFEKM